MDGEQQGAVPDGEGHLYPVAVLPAPVGDGEAASAWGAGAAPELLDTYQLWWYLDKAYTSAANDEDRAAALMGLAALDRLDDVQGTPSFCRRHPLPR